MQNILSKLYDQFCNIPKNPKTTQRIDENHKLLIQRLSKRNRKLVLRIIDDKDLICEEASRDSFIQGFRLGMMLTIEMLYENGGILRDTTE